MRPFFVASARRPPHAMGIFAAKMAAAAVKLAVNDREITDPLELKRLGAYRLNKAMARLRVYDDLDGTGPFPSRLFPFENGVGPL